MMENFKTTTDEFHANSGGAALEFLPTEHFDTMKDFQEGKIQIPSL